MKKLSLLILLSTILISCGKKTESQDKEVELTYDLTSNGCATGKHVFRAKSKKEALKKYCKALTDGELNNGCAQNLRAMKFKESCKGIQVESVSCVQNESSDYNYMNACGS